MSLAIRLAGLGLLIVGCAVVREPAPEPPPRAVEPAQELRPRLEATEEEALLAQARRDVDLAAELVTSLESQRLSAEGSERLATARDLLDGALAALEAGDAFAASTLAEKASTLARDLADR
jgi:hypothetical protein